MNTVMKLRILLNAKNLNSW